MGTKIIGIAATEDIDTSGEVLSIDGCNLDTIEDGRGYLNWEHSGNEDNGENIVGKVLRMKKILSKEDCETPKQLYFFEKCRNRPYLYMEGELFDDPDAPHPGALCIASIIRYGQKTGEEMQLGLSVEGSTHTRDGNKLIGTIIKGVALTIKPCNRSAFAQILEDNPEFRKAMGDDSFEPLAKGIPTSIEDSFEQEDSIVDELIEAASLMKTLTAGVATAVPGQNVGGSALQVDDKVKKNDLISDKLYHIHTDGARITHKPLSLKEISKVYGDIKTLESQGHKIIPQEMSISKEEMFSALCKMKAAIRDRGPGKSPVDAVKAELPMLGPKFKEHFDNLLQDLSLTKNEADVISPCDVLFHVAHYDDQKRLISGIFVHPLENGEGAILTNSSGLDVWVKKGHSDEGEWNSSSERAVIYFNLARDFWGMSDHVPMTSAFLHPQTKATHHAEIVIPSSRSGHEPGEFSEQIKNAANSGVLHRICLMDYVMGVHDRHLGNIIIDPINNIFVTDNDKCLGSPNYPEYMFLLDAHNKIVPHEEISWLQGFDSKMLLKSLLDSGCPKEYSKHCALRLERAKHQISQYASLDSLYE